MDGSLVHAAARRGGVVNQAAAPVEDLVANVERGAKWLGEHDPDGSNYLWWKMGMTPLSPMPGQSEARRQEFIVWYRAYERWRSLYSELERRSEDDAKRIIEGVLA